MSANPLGVFCGIPPQCKHWPLIICLGRVSGWLNTPMRTGPDFLVPYCPARCKKTCCSLLTWHKVFRFLVTNQLYKYQSVFLPTHYFLDATSSCTYELGDSYFHTSLGLICFKLDNNVIYSVIDEWCTACFYSCVQYCYVLTMGADCTKGESLRSQIVQWQVSMEMHSNAMSVSQWYKMNKELCIVSWGICKYIPVLKYASHIEKIKHQVNETERIRKDDVTMNPGSVSN